MAIINIALSVKIIGGPQVAISKSKSVEAYDKIDVVVEPSVTDDAPTGTPKSVEVQPSTDTQQISFLLIKSNLYGSELTYVVSDDDSSSEEIALDEPHLYLGTGAVSVLGVAPKTIAFTNSNPVSDPPDSSKNAVIEILVGRDATPPPSEEG